VGIARIHAYNPHKSFGAVCSQRGANHCCSEEKKAMNEEKWSFSI